MAAGGKGKDPRKLSDDLEGAGHHGYFVVVPSEDHVDEINLAELWNAIWKGRWIIFGTTLLFLIGAVSYAYLKTPIYRAEALLAPVEYKDRGGMLSNFQNQFGGLAALTGISFGSHGGTREQYIAALKSRTFTQGVIEDLDLLPILFEESWDQDKQYWVVDEVDIPTIHDAWELFNEKIRTVEEKEDGLVVLSIEWRDREQAVFWVNEIVKRINEELRNEAITKAEHSIEYLNQELEKTGIVELEQVIYRLVESQINEIMIANVQQEYAFKIIDPPQLSDIDKFHKPNRGLMAVIGLFIGIFFGAFVVLLYQLHLDS
ncbi:MAG: Wzz/FepE/Etk N-terminal domain-containing protein [Gammaproteobacteria bacterium]|nr:Wzz/FepE/Etk N-terminal domain-containing protein [Gammaproteobacteria bacterium]